MKPPVRVVCCDCLHTMELTVDDPWLVPVVCPACGGTVDTQPDLIEEASRLFAGTLPLDRNKEVKGPWAETWRNGSLGTFGRYQLRELLGGGGFGQVYQAYDPRLDRDVALKVLKQSNPDERTMQRFFREARAAARLQHPNIVSVYDAGHEAGRCWIAYRFVQGQNLGRYRARREIGTEAAVRIIRDLALALDQAHEQGIVHRDLKPANVIIDEQGRPHLTDFGLARRADLGSDLSRDGDCIGTPAYMSPEQARGRSDLADERSDVFSLGLILCELLGPRRPPGPPFATPASPRGKGGAPPSPRSPDRAIPGELGRICRKALAQDPGQRYQDARAMAEDLGRWLARRRAGAVLSRPLVCIAMGLASAALSTVVLWAALAPAEPPRALPAPTRPGVVPPPPAPQAASEPPPRPTQPPAEAVVPGPEDVAKFPLVGNRLTQTFHRQRCPTVHSIAAANRVGIADVAEALGRDFKPCEICRPAAPVPGAPGAGGASPDPPKGGRPRE